MRQTHTGSTHLLLSGRLMAGAAMLHEGQYELVDFGTDRHLS